jgi:N-acetylneuraminic acid mutarotase
MRSYYFCFILIILAEMAFAQQGQWQQMSDLPGNSWRHHPVTWGIGNFGYVVTGTNINNQSTSDFFKYDAAEDSWEVLAPFPGPSRGYSYGSVHNGKGYIGFGFSGSQFLNDLWRYDPETAEWEQLASCPCPGRAHPAFVFAQNKLFMGLGNNNAQGNFFDWWEYDIETNTWTERPELPSFQRHHPYYFEINDLVYVGLGHGAIIFNDWYMYDPGDHSWTRMNDYPQGGRVAGTQFSYGGKGYVLSGDDEQHITLPTGEFFEYDPVSDSWTELPPHPGTGRWAPGTFLIDNKVYFTGGLDRDGFLKKDLWMYELEPASSTKSNPATVADFEVYPNPASDKINLPEGVSAKSVEVVNISGMTVLSIKDQGSSIDVSRLQPGQYTLLVVSDSGKEYRSRFIKQ